MQNIEDNYNSEVNSVSEESLTPADVAVKGEPLSPKKPKKKRRRNSYFSREQIEHNQFQYYCQNIGKGGDAAYYRCRMVLRPGETQWESSKCGSHSSRLEEGTERCPGRLTCHVRRGEKFYTGGLDHVCTMSNVNCYGVPDDRCVMELCVPAQTWGSSDLLKDIHQDLTKFSDWHDLTGGGKGTDRVYLPTLETDPKLAPLCEKVKTAARPYVKWLHARYPKLRHLRYGLIKTLPNGRSQYELHGNRTHADFGNTVYRLAPDERPVSMMIALNEFNLMYLSNMSDPDTELKTMTVHKHNGVLFTSACLHSGAANLTQVAQYRIFLYAVSRVVDFPTNQVFISDRTEEGETRAELRALDPNDDPDVLKGSKKVLKKPASVSSRGRTVFEVDRLYAV